MTGQAMTRRGLLTAVLLAPPALVACSATRTPEADRPDPLVALAAAARADAALAAAVIAAAPKLAGRVAPLRDARTQHAVALEAEVARAAGATTPAGAPTSASSTPTATPATASLARLRTAVAASGNTAGELVRTAEAHRVGLVASVAVCCTSYAAALV